MINRELCHDGMIYNISIGRNSRENWTIIENSNENDIWFHLNDYPSPHIVLKYNEFIPENIILECCNLCKKYSKYKNFPAKYLKVVYTKINNLKKGSDIGSVILIKNKKNTIETI